MVLIKRVLSALIGIPLLLWCTYRGGMFLFLIVLILTIYGMREYCYIIENSGHSVIALLLWVGSIAFLGVVEFDLNHIGLTILLYLLLSYMLYLYYYPRYKPQDLALTLLGVLYVVYGFSHIILLRNLNNGFFVLLFVFIIIWTTDTGAFFVGNFMGKHKIAPVLSPKKSWEGFIGGILLSVLAAFVLQNYYDSNLRQWLVFIAPFISVSGQIGDFFESSLKRYANVKDSGNTIPGHGGVLDRFDSMLWAAPLTYYLFLYLERMI